MNGYNVDRDVIYLASCAINKQIPEKDRVAAMNLDEVYDCASRHMIKAVIAFALESAGYKDSRSKHVIGEAMIRTALFDKEWNLIRGRFEEKGIWYMPLKGAVIKSFYPKYGMREFIDYDVLIDDSCAADVERIMKENAYSVKLFDRGNHDVYFKEPVLLFEMHRDLFGPQYENRLYKYYENVRERLLTKAGYEKCFSAEDFYIYMLAHEYKHYSKAGTGIRSLRDTYVILNKVSLDMDYVSAEVKKLEIDEFEEKNRSLSQHLFGNEELTEADQKMLDYILSSGAYGTQEQRIRNTISKKRWNKMQYALKRFLVPVSKKNPEYAVFARVYPFFYQHKFLLPILPFYRTIHSFKRGRFKKEAKALKDVKKDV